MRRVKSFLWRNRRHGWLLFVYVFLIAVFHRWFGPGSFANGDLGYLTSDNITYVNAPYIWKGFHDTGVYYAETPYILINYISSIPSLLFNVVFNAVTLKALFFYPYIFLAPLGAYLLGLRLTKNAAASAAAALIYTINTPILLSFAMGHIHLAMPPIFLPFVLLMVMEYLEKDRKTYLLFALNLVLLVMSAYELRFWYLGYGWVCLYVLYELFTNRFIQWRRALLFFISTAVSAVLFNMYWVLPTVLSSVNLQTNPLLQRAAFGNEYLSVMNAVALFHPYWTTRDVAVFTSQTIPWIFFVLPLAAAAGLYVARKNRTAIFFGMLMLIGIILTKQFNYPLSFVYQILLDRFPGFKLFRESTKFFHVIALAYAMLSAYWIAYCWSKRRRLILTAASLIPLMALVVFIAYPIFNGNAKTIFVPVEPYDGDYVVLNSFLKKQQAQGYFRTLHIPTGSSHAPISDTMPVLHFTSLHNQWYSTLEKRHNLGVSSLSDLFLYPEIGTILDMYSVRYVILPKQSTRLESNLYYWYETKETYMSLLDRLPYLHKLDIGTDEIAVYENASYRPHLSVSGVKESLFAPANYSNIAYIYHNPTSYEIRLNELKTPVYVNFAESYSPDWHISVGKSDWTDALVGGKEIIPDIFHFQNDAQLNSFYISPDYIRKNAPAGDYTVNPDGSISATMTIYFRPQSYVMAGFISSVATVVTLCGLALYSRIRRI